MTNLECVCCLYRPVHQLSLELLLLENTRQEESNAPRKKKISATLRIWEGETSRNELLVLCFFSVHTMPLVQLHNALYLHPEESRRAQWG